MSRWNHKAEKNLGKWCVYNSLGKWCVWGNFLRRLEWKNTWFVSWWRLDSHASLELTMHGLVWDVYDPAVDSNKSARIQIWTVGWSSIYRFFGHFNQHILNPAVWGMKIYQQNQQKSMEKSWRFIKYITANTTITNPNYISVFFLIHRRTYVFATKRQSATKIWPCPTSHSQLPGGPSRPEAGKSSQRCYPGSLFTSKLLVLFMPNLVTIDTIGFDPAPCRSPNSFFS